MILKVMTKLQDKEGWLILGELKDVSWRRGLMNVAYYALLAAGELGDYLVFDNPNPEWSEASGEPSYDANEIIQKCKQLTITDRMGKTIDVWFNDVAYLMNDEGKTVETIYGY